VENLFFALQKVRGLPDWQMALFLATARIGAPDDRRISKHSECSTVPEEDEL